MEITFLPYSILLLTPISLLLEVVRHSKTATTFYFRFLVSGSPGPLGGLLEARFSDVGLSFLGWRGRIGSPIVRCRRLRWKPSALSVLSGELRLARQ